MVLKDPIREYVNLDGRLNQFIYAKVFGSVVFSSPFSGPHDSRCALHYWPPKASQRSATKYVTLSRRTKRGIQYRARECWNWMEQGTKSRVLRTGAVNNKDSAIWRRPAHTHSLTNQGKQGQKGKTNWLKRKANRTQCFCMWGGEMGSVEQKMSRRQRHLLKATPFHGLNSSFLGTTRLHSTHPQSQEAAHPQKHTHAIPYYTIPIPNTWTTKSKVNHWNFAS